MTETKEPYFGISGRWSYFAVFGLPALFFHAVVIYALLPPGVDDVTFILCGILVLAALFSLFLSTAWGCAGMLYASLRRRPVSPSDELCVAVGLVGYTSVASALVLTYVLSLLLPDSLPRGSYGYQFSSSSWQAESATAFVQGGVTRRQEMLGSLVDQLTPEMGRNEIMELLGPPAPSGYPYGADGSDLHYFTGLERDYRFDGEWLLIYLDEEGKYERYSIYVD